MKAGVPPLAALLCPILALAGCATTGTPSPSAQASATSEPTGQATDLAAVVCDVAPKPFDPSNIDLTGPWAGDDGGIYYLRQVGLVVWWNGMSERDGSPLGLGREWNNVGRGVINGLQIDVEWADVPRGQLEVEDDGRVKKDTGQGTLILSIQDDGTGNVQIVTFDGGDAYGSRLWTPCAPVELQIVEYVRTYGGDPHQYGLILTLDACADLADLNETVSTALDTADAGSPDFQAALGYSHAISERQLALDC